MAYSLIHDLRRSSVLNRFNRLNRFVYYLIQFSYVFTCFVRFTIPKKKCGFICSVPTSGDSLFWFYYFFNSLYVSFNLSCSFHLFTFESIRRCLNHIKIKKKKIATSRTSIIDISKLKYGKHAKLQASKRSITMKEEHEQDSNLHVSHPYAYACSPGVENTSRYISV